MTNYYLQVFRKFADFSGRARRAEYWTFVLFNLIFQIVALLLDHLAHTTINGSFYGFFYLSYALIATIPLLAVTVRRLHDSGKNGAMFFINFIPVIGLIWFIILMVSDSEEGDNGYGDNPKEHEFAANYEKHVDEDSTKSNQSQGKTFILIFLIYIFITELYNATVPKFIDDYYRTELFQFVNIAFSLIGAFVPIGLVYAIRKKSTEVILFSISAIIMLYRLYVTTTLFFI